MIVSTRSLSPIMQSSPVETVFEIMKFPEKYERRWKEIRDAEAAAIAEQHQAAIDRQAALTEQQEADRRKEAAEEAETAANEARSRLRVKELAIENSERELEVREKALDVRQAGIDSAAQSLSEREQALTNDRAAHDAIKEHNEEVLRRCEYALTEREARCAAKEREYTEAKIAALKVLAADG